MLKKSKNIWKNQNCFMMLVVIAAVVLFLPIRVMAAVNTGTVRVGVYEMEGFHSFNADGSCVGYDVDYLNKISQSTGWTYEYVKADNWGDAIGMLDAGQIDLLAPAQMTPERVLEYGFSAQIGKDYGAILALQDREDLIYEDFENFSTIRFGAERNTSYVELLEQYAKDNGFTADITLYGSSGELFSALRNGEIDAAIHNIMRAGSDMKLIGKAGNAPFYYIYDKDNTKLGEELNDALNEIEIDEPDFQRELIEKYFPIYNEDPYTKEELDYVKTLPILRVAVDADARPLSYVDPDTGALTGITVDLLDLISEYSGIRFEYVSTASSGFSPEELSAAEIDLIAGARNNSHNQNKYGLMLSGSYLETQAVLVSRRGMVFNEQSSGTMAFVAGSEELREIIAENFPGFELMGCESVEDCFDAVAAGLADCCIQNQYIADYEFNKPKYEKLEAIPNSGYDEKFSILNIDSEKVDDPVMFMSIIDKAVKKVGDEEAEQYIIKYTTAMPYHLSPMEIYDKYQAPIMVILVLLGLIIVISLVFMSIRNRQLRMIRETNGQLEEKNAQLSVAIARADHANHSKSEFLARMSHEIRTPMNAIIGETTLATKNIESQGKVKECLDKVMVSSRHLLSLINDILDMSAIESNKIKIAKSRFDLKEVVSTVTTLYYSQCRSKGITFEARMENITVEFLVGDQLRLQQIILNLLSNALKFTEPGGRIVFAMREDIPADSQEVILHIGVSDTGCGMSEEYMNRIFRPFEQENALTAKEHGGSGLGLSISKNLIELMGGTIEVQSAVGEGTSFSIVLPCIQSESQEQMSHDEVSGMRAVVVDDDRDALEYVSSILNHIGIDFDSFDDAEEALHRITKARNDKKGYDLCLLDWKMQGISGIELTKKIRMACGEQPIVIIASAFDLAEIGDEADEAGVDLCIEKPLFQSSVFNVLMSLSKGKLVSKTAKPEEYDFTGKRVLLVDDTPINREIAQELLEMVGFIVDVACDGKEGADTFEASEEGTYDLILMDVQMPVMNGYEATKKIRGSAHPQAKEICIIAMTANAFTEDIAASMDAGMDDHISKPIDTELMYEVLARHVTV